MRHARVHLLMPFARPSDAPFSIHAFSAGTCMPERPGYLLDGVVFGRCCHPANDATALQARQDQVNAMLKARNGGANQAARRILNALPYPPQSASSSPFLDMSVYSFDDATAAAVDRARPCPEHPFQFFERQTDQFKFSIDPFPKPFVPGSFTTLRDPAM